MDRGAWWDPGGVHGVAKSQTRLSTHTCTHAYINELLCRALETNTTLQINYSFHFLREKASIYTSMLLKK